MVRIPSLSRHEERTSTRDGDRDGRVDDRRPVSDTGARGTDTRSDTDTGLGSDIKSPHTVTSRGTDTRIDDRDTDEVTRRGRATATAPTEVPPRTEVDRPIADRASPGTTPRHDPSIETERVPEVVVPAGPRPRASMLATLGLIFGVASALFVLTGTLAGYGIGLGAIALLLSIGGVSATSRRHVAGRSEAMIGLLLGLGAVIVGVLALTGEFSWPTTDADAVQRFREWLDTQFVDRF